MDIETIVELQRFLDATAWDDIDAVEAETRKVLDTLTGDRSAIRSVLMHVPRRPDLLALCEHYDILDKIVLWDDPAGFRVRLHVLVAEPYTVSLVVRGPAVKDRFLVMDRVTGKSWWQYGAAQESPEEAAEKRMSIERFREVRRQLDQWDAF